MKVLKQNVGLEVDSKKIKVSVQIMLEDLSIKILGSRTWRNKVKVFGSMKDWIEKKRKQDCEVHLTMEATGVYYENLAYFFNEQNNFVVHVLLPNMSNAFRKSLNEKSKTDEIDARLLGQLGLERMLRKWEPISDQMRQLKKMNRERLRLNKEKTMVTNQLHAEQASYNPLKTGIKRYEKRLKFIAKQIEQIEKELKQIVDKDQHLKTRIDNACTAKGLAFITVCGIVSELNGFALFTNRNQLVSFTGYDVVKTESGTSVHGPRKISKKGNSYVRQMLYMAAMSAAQCDDHHRDYYQRIVNKTGIKMKANVAIQRKLLLLIYTLFKNNLPYDPEYHKILKEKLSPNQKENSSILNEQINVKGRQDTILPTLDSTLV
jgi:transposase